MHRLLSYLLIGVLLLSALSGCQKNKSAAQPSPEPTAEPTAEPFDPYAEVEAAEIKEGRHEREDGYKNPFKTHVLDTSGFTLHLENSDRYSDETLRTLAKTVADDRNAIGRYTGETPEKVTIYAVWNLLQDCPLLLGDHIICSAEQIENGTYREALIGMCLDLSIPWKQVGLSELIFGTPDDSGLTAYYADEAHALTASCSAVYFLDGFADGETVAAARQTAASITAYILETEGLEAFRAAVDTADVLPAWSEKNGINTVPVLPDGHERAAAAIAYRTKTPGRLCVLQCGNYTFNVNDGSFAGTPDEVYDFVCRFLYGKEFVLEQIREESPVLYETAERREKEPIKVSLVRDATQSGISYGGLYEIELVRCVPAWHELVHALVIAPASNGNHWMNEAIAEHFSGRATSFAMKIKQPNAPDFSQDDEFLAAFWKAYWAIYCADRESNGIPAQYGDFSADSRAIGIAELLLTDDLVSAGRDFSVGTVNGIKTGSAETDGNALSYGEATVMLEYLFETYGTDTIVSGVMNGVSIEEICGKPYAELYRDCVAYYTEKYGDLIGLSK